MRGNTPVSPLVDFHAHCLPKVDHGSSSLAVATEQRRLMRLAGLSTVVATPHFYAHEETSVDAFLERRDAAADALLAACPEGPTLVRGAEVLVTPGLDAMEGLSRLCIEGTDLLLLEMPLGRWSQEVVATALRIARLGVRPILAHIDRYEIDDIESLLDEVPFLLQLNASAVLGLSRRAAFFRRWIGDGEIAALGSDLHGVHPSAYRHFLRAVRRLGDQGDRIMARAAALLS